MPRAISDASTLIHLAGIGRFELLKAFYERIIIPPAVWREVVEEGRGRAGASEVENGLDETWIEILTPDDEALVRLLKQDLNDGEAEAIALAVAGHAEMVFLDETDARQTADVFGLRKTGVIGLLIRARLNGMLLCLREELDRLRQDAGFWIDEQLYKEALEAVGENR